MYIGDVKTDNSVYLYVGFLSLLTLVNGVFESIVMENIEMCGHQVRLQVVTLVYKKMLRLSPKGLSQTSGGKLINLVANDTMFYEALSAAFSLAVGPAI